MDTDGLLNLLKQHLPAPARGALETSVRICNKLELNLFLVGGAVRDLLLERRTVDLDLAIEGNVDEVAQALAQEFKGRAVLHSRFGTATISAPGFQLDLARTRRETYTRPGALPSVEPAMLADDLARRDFTINALALRLTEPTGVLVDPFGGLGDVEARLIRVLHDRSFQDDATRMLRAARYGGRLGFQIEAGTKAWLRRDLRFLDTIRGPRLRRELGVMFSEKQAVDEVLMAEKLGLLRVVHPALGLNDDIAPRWRDGLEGPHFAPLDELGFCVVVSVRDEAAIRSFSDRLHLTGRIENALRDVVRLEEVSAKLAASRKAPAAVVEMLDGSGSASIWALAVREGGDVAEACYSHLGDWRHVLPHLRGDDLLSLGVPPGKAVGEALKTLRRARLEGRTTTREDEIELIREGLGMDGSYGAAT